MDGFSSFFCFAEKHLVVGYHFVMLFKRRALKNLCGGRWWCFALNFNTPPGCLAL